MPRSFLLPRPQLMRGACAAQRKWGQMHGSRYVPRPPRPGEVSAFKGVGKLDRELWASTSCDQANPEYYGTCAAPASASMCRIRLLFAESLLCLRHASSASTQAAPRSSGHAWLPS